MIQVHFYYKVRSTRVPLGMMLCNIIDKKYSSYFYFVVVVVVLHYFTLIVLHQFFLYLSSFFTSLVRSTHSATTEPHLKLVSHSYFYIKYLYMTVQKQHGSKVHYVKIFLAV